MRERDSQKARLYKAERVALEPIKTTFPTIKDVRKYIIKQSKRATLIRRYGKAMDLTNWELDITDGRGTRNGLAHGTYKISLPAGWARCDRVALHEFAHIIHNRTKSRHVWAAGDRSTELSNPQAASHGREFAMIYLDLVKFCMGAEAYEALKASFVTHRVKFKHKRKT